MADAKISALTTATTPLAGTEVVPVVQSSTTKKVSVSNLTAGRDVSAASYSATGNAYFGDATALSGDKELGLGSNAAVNAFLNINSAGNSQLRIHINSAYRGGMYSTGDGIMVASNGQLNFSVDGGGNAFGYFGAEIGGVSNFHISNGNLVIGTSGKGIDFSADGSAAGMTSELLDDYEEGTWTPTTAGDATGAFSAQSGKYVKVGRIVTVYAVFNVSTNFTSGAVGGLPYIPDPDAAISGLFGRFICQTQSGAEEFYLLNNANINFDAAPDTTKDIYRLSVTYITS